jgi:hypothetical protein
MGPVAALRQGTDPPKEYRTFRKSALCQSATSVDLEVAMPSGYLHSRAVRRRLFDQVCLGVPLWGAAQDMGVSTTAATIWWRNAGAMKLVGGRGGGIADPGNMSWPGGQGHRLSLDERIVIMRGRDTGLSHAVIGRQIGRDRITIWREVGRNRNADGDYHAPMAHAGGAKRSAAQGVQAGR